MIGELTNLSLPYAALVADGWVPDSTMPRALNAEESELILPMFHDRLVTELAEVGAFLVRDARGAHIVEFADGPLTDPEHGGVRAAIAEAEADLLLWLNRLANFLLRVEARREHWSAALTSEWSTA